MNKYIKTDIEQGKEKEIRFEASLPLQLIIQCTESRGWEDDHEDDWTNGWEVDYFYRMIHPDKKDKCLHVNGSLLCGNTSIRIDSYV